MSAQSLPHSLTRLKDQAKQLLKDFRDGEPDVVASFGQHHPRAVKADQAKLADAQLVLARSRGFDSWPKLRRDAVGEHLRKAIWDGDLSGVAAAVDAEPDLINDTGKHPRWGGQPTALQLAAERGQTDIIRLLISQSADLDFTEGYGGWTALHLAAHWGHTAVAELLIDHGATVDIFAAVLLGDVETVGRLLEGDSSLATTSELSDTPPLHVVTNSDVARQLIAHGAMLGTIDSLGNTPLGSAISRGERGRSVARLLIDEGAPADPCQLAALGDTSRLSETISADSSAISFEGKIGVNAVIGTPLHAASAAGETETVQLLLAHGADPNVRADMGQTPLHNTSSVDIARFLVEAGADPFATDDEHGTTPLVWANIAIDIHGESEERRELVEYLESVSP